MIFIDARVNLIKYMFFEHGIDNFYRNYQNRNITNIKLYFKAYFFANDIILLLKEKNKVKTEFNRDIIQISIINEYT